MFQHTLLLAYRSFRRFKSTFLINLIGLSTGLACALFIYLWVSDELRMDKFHEKDNRLYQVMENHQQNGSTQTQPFTSGLLAKELIKEIPEIEYAVAVAPPFLIDEMLLSTQGKKIKGVGEFADKDFFNVFSYDLLTGNKNTVLADKNSIVLSEAMALKLFNTTENLIGRELHWESEEMKAPVLVSGIFKNTPANSSEQFDFLLSYDAFLGQDDTFLQWGNYGPYAYLTLKASTNVDQVNRKIKNFMDKKGAGSFRTLFLAKYSDNYLYGKYENGVQTGGRIQYVKMFSIIALFILFIACINFMNLSTAKAARRMKEVGVKKVMGASRKALLLQYFGESVLMTFISLSVAILFVAVLLPQFNEITGKNISLGLESRIIGPTLSITFITGLLAGVYPAIYLSGFKPIIILKGNFRASLNALLVRKGLVVFQFAVSVVFIVAVLVVYKQIDFIQSKSLGYDKDHLLTFEPTGKAVEKKAAFLAEARKIPGITHASSIGHSMVSSGAHTQGVYWEGKDPQSTISFEVAEADYDLIETLGVKLVAGRSFSPDFGAEKTKIICNEAALEAMSMQNDAIGKTISLWSPDNKMEIVGVVKNFHFESLHQHIKPLFFVFDPAEADEVVIKMAAGTKKEVIQNLEKLHATFNPDYTLDYKFLDDEYQALYASEQRVAVLSRYFAGIAILISCLGLFGLAAFTAERRRKEIGVRKVLGASRFSIVYLLSSDFTKLVVISIGLSLPLSYLLVKNWLQNFEYRIDLQWWYFVGAGLAALVIAWLTVSSQAMKAASVNPAQSLKDE